MSAATPAAAVGSTSLPRAAATRPWQLVNERKGAIMTYVCSSCCERAERRQQSLVVVSMLWSLTLVLCLKAEATKERGRECEAEDTQTETPSSGLAASALTAFSLCLTLNRSVEA